MSTTLTAQITAILTAKLGRAPTADEILNAEGDSLLLSLVQNNLQVGQNSLVATPTDDIATMIANMASDGAGILYLSEGTYTLSGFVSLQGKIQIIGIGKESTVIDLSNGKTIEANNAGGYSTGTVTSVAGQTVTGSGTTWVGNVNPGDSFFLQSRWYVIETVTDNTHIVLRDYYSDNVVLPTTYKIKATIDDITFKDLSIISSAGGSGLNFLDARNIFLENINFLDNNVGISFTNCSETYLSNITVTGSTSDGIQATNVGLSAWDTVTCINNGGHGIKASTFKTVSITASNCLSNTADGVNITTGIELNLNIDATNNGGQGMEFVATSDNISIYNGRYGNNNSDGIKLTATGTKIRIYGNYLHANGGFGINLAVSSDTDNTINNNNFFANGSGPISDSGLRTTIATNSALAGNQGVVDTNPITTRVTTQFDKTTNTTLADVTGLSANLLGLNSSKAGKIYAFEALLYVDADVVGGSKFAIGGTATATSIKYQIMFLDNSTNTYTINSRQTVLAGSAGQAGTTAGLCIIKGIIVTNATGTLTVQFAQNASNATSSILVNSTFRVWESN